MSRTVSLQIGPGRAFVRARMPKGMAPSSSKVQNALSNMDQRVSSGGKCTVVFFKRGGGLKAVQRCEGRTLKASAKRRFNKSRPCVSGKTKKFVKCGAGARRARKSRKRR